MPTWPFPYGFSTPCREEDGSPTEQYTDSGFHATVSLLCDWDQRYNLAGEVSAYVLYPRNPSSLARCRNISIVPYTKSQGNDFTYQWCIYDTAKVTLEYVFDKKSPQTTDLYSEELDPTAEHLTLDYRNFRWKTLSPDPKSPGSNVRMLEEGEAPSMLMRGLDYVLTAYNLSSVPAAALTLIGCVNNAAVTAKYLGMTFAKDTLLWNPPSVQRKVQIGSATSLKYTATYRMTFKTTGWNKYWNAKNNTWDIIQRWNGSTWVDYYQYPQVAFTGF